MTWGFGLVFLGGCVYSFERIFDGLYSVCFGGLGCVVIGRLLSAFYIIYPLPYLLFVLDVLWAILRLSLCLFTCCYVCMYVCLYVSMGFLLWPDVWMMAMWIYRTYGNAALQ